MKRIAQNEEEDKLLLRMTKEGERFNINAVSASAAIFSLNMLR